MEESLQLLRSRILLPIVILSLLACIGYGQLLNSDTVPYSKYSDIIAQHLGIKMFIYKSFRENLDFPFWRNDIMSGLPLFTNPESQFFYPLHILFYFMPPWKAMGPTIWLHFVIGGLVLYFIGRTMQLSTRSCLFMACAQLFNFKMIAGTFAGFLPILPILIFFPLLFAAYFYVLQQPNLKGATAVAAASVICLNTGVFQLYYYSILFIMGYFALKVIFWCRGKQFHSIWKTSSWIALGLLLSAGIMAYHLLPLAAESPLLSRTKSTYEFFLSGYSLTYKHLLTFLYPESLGSLFEASDLDRYLWEDIGYFGIIPLLLAVVGGIYGWRKPYGPQLSISFLAALLLATDSPLLRLIYKLLPGFGLFRAPNRFLYLSGFFGICLAGIGLEIILSRLSRNRKNLATGFAILVMTLIAIEGVYYAKRYVYTEPVGDILPKPAYLNLFEADAAPYRIAPLFRHTINSGWSAPMNLELITGYTPFNLKYYQTYLQLLQYGKTGTNSAYSWADIFNITRWDLVDALNVKYIASPVSLETLYRNGFKEAPNLQEEAVLKAQPMFFFFNLGLQQKTIHIFRNKNALNRAFWVNRLVPAADEEEVLRQMQHADLHETAVIKAASNASIEQPRTFQNTVQDTVGIVSASAGGLQLKVQNQEERFLVISEIWHPGWQGELDGRTLQLRQTNATLMGALIPPGQHTLKIRFKPLLWNKALIISMTAMLLFIGCLGRVLYNTCKRQADRL